MILSESLVKVEAWNTSNSRCRIGYRSRGYKIPNMIVLHLDTAEKLFLTLILKDAKIKSTPDLQWKLHDLINVVFKNQSTQRQGFLDAVALFRKGSPEAVESVRVTKGEKETFNYAARDLQMFEIVIKKLYDIDPQANSEDLYREYEGMKVFYDSDLIDPTRHLEALKKAKEYLGKRGYEYLILSKPIKIRKLKNSQFGLYYNTTDELSISQDNKAHDFNALVETIIHELAHRLDYKFMSREDQITFQTIYMNAMIADARKTSGEFFRTMSAFSNAKELVFNHKPSKAFGAKMKMISADERKKTFFFTMKRGTDGYKVTLSLKDALSNVLVDGEKFSPEQSASQKMFVTDYAKTNEREFLAETFEAWIMGKLATNPRFADLYEKIDPIFRKYMR